MNDIDEFLAVMLAMLIILLMILLTYLGQPSSSRFGHAGESVARR